MRKSLKIIVLAIILSLFFVPSVFADSIYYQDNGNIDFIELTGFGSLYFYEDGKVDFLSTHQVSVYFYENGNIDFISAPSGSVYYHEDGRLDYVTGDFAKIMKEAQDAAQKYYDAVVDYCNQMNIGLEGAKSPADDLEKLYDVLNNLITNYNNSQVNNQGSSNNSDTQNGSSVNINNNGTSININNSSDSQKDSTVTGNNATLSDYGIEFYPNSYYKRLVLPEGTVTWYENSYISSIITDDLTYYNYENGYIKLVSTPSGTIKYLPNGTIESVSATYATIIAEAEAEYEKLNKAFINFIENGTITGYGNVSVNANQGGASINLGNNVNANGNSADINLGDNFGISAGEDGANINLGGMVGIDANENGVNINLGGFQISANENGVNMGVVDNTNKNDSNSGNSVVKYILLGLVFVVAFVILVFGIIAIKKKNNQIVIKDNNQNPPYNQ